MVQVTTWAGLDIHPSLSPDGNAVAYSSDHGGSFEIYVRPMTPGSRETQITNDGKSNFEPAWSPDGQRIAYYSKDRGGIWIVPALGGNAKQVSRFGSHPAWSPDGSWLAFQSDPITNLGSQASASQPPSLIWLVPANGSAEPTRLTQLGHPAGGHGAPAWSTDGKQIVMSVSDFAENSIWIVPRIGGEPREVIDAGLDPVYGPDGKSLYYTTASGIWRTQLSPETGTPVGEPMELTSNAVERIRYFSISADGKKIVYSSLLTNSNLWSLPMDRATSVPTGSPSALTQDRSLRSSVAEFSPDGLRIAFMKANRTRASTDIWIMDADGKNVRQVTTEGGGLASWFPDGEQLAFLSARDPRRTWIANLQTGQEKAASMDFGEPVNYMRMSRDGKQILFNSKRTGTTNTWIISADGGQPKQLTFDAEFMGFGCWSPDGKLLALQLKRGEDTYVCIMSSNGGPITQLTVEKGQSWPNDFSPDADKIVFAGFRDGVWNLWWISRTTREEKKLTNYSKVNSFVRYPAWSPLGNQIAYEYVETTGNIWVGEIN
jgi:Tol biopolymer transport system component